MAVAVIALCDGCIVAYTDAAFKHGATREEIVEALGVAVAVKAGAALLYSARVIDEVQAKGKSKFKPRKSEMYTRTIFDSSLSILIVAS